MTIVKLSRNNIDELGNGAIVIKSGSVFIGMVPCYHQLEDGGKTWEINLLTSDQTPMDKDDFVGDHESSTLNASDRPRSVRTAWTGAAKLLRELADAAEWEAKRS